MSSVRVGVVQGDEVGGVRAEMHPVLYPILLLLARLRTGGGAAVAGTVEVGGCVIACARNGWDAFGGCMKVLCTLTSTAPQ